MSNNCKNYKTDNGDTWVVGGKLKVETGAAVEGLPKAANQADSTASTIAALVVEFNALLTKLKTAGLMVGDET